jgi:hypothetical protein
MNEHASRERVDNGVTETCSNAFLSGKYQDDVNAVILFVSMVIRRLD